MKWLWRMQSLSPRTVLAIGFALFLVYAFPGYMSTDSVAQLVEARTGQFSDAHPPIMAAQWWVLDRIVSGPILMLLLQGSLFLGGLYMLLRRYLDERPAAWTAVAVLLFPPVLCPMAVIWKDSQMAAFLVAGSAAILQANLRVRVAGLALLVIGCGLRHNAIASVVPLVFFLFEWRAGVRWWKRVAILTAACALTVAATFALSRMLTVTRVKITPVFQDIVGVLAFTDDRSDDDLRHVLRGTPLLVEESIQERARMLYLLRGPWRITQGNDRMFDYPDNLEEWTALSRAWQELVLDDPAAYLAAHWDGYARLIGLSETPRATVWNLFLEVPETMRSIEHSASWSGAQAWLGHAFIWIAVHTPLFLPYVYALAALVLLALCCRDRVTGGLFASGLLYELSFFPFSADPDYRYSHWLITSVCLACVILFVQRRRQAR